MSPYKINNHLLLLVFHFSNYYELKKLIEVFPEKKSIIGPIISNYKLTPEEIATTMYRLYSGIFTYQDLQLLTFVNNKWHSGADTRPYFVELMRNIFPHQTASKMKLIFASYYSLYRKNTKFDDNFNLIGFKNGVYDLHNNTFRIAQADDFISKSTGYDYISFSSDFSDPIFGEIKEYLSRVFPNEQVLKYVLTLLGSFLSGSSYPDKKINFFTGTGGNGKSTFLNFFKNCLGEYSTQINICQLSNKYYRLEHLYGYRFVYWEYNTENGFLNNNLVRSITLQTPLSNWLKEMIPRFNVVIQTNDGINLTDNYDNFIWNHLRVINFPSRFVSGSQPITFKADRQLNIKINSLQWKQAFMFLLLEYNKQYLLNGLPETPVEIKNATKTLMDENYNF